MTVSLEMLMNEVKKKREREEDANVDCFRIGEVSPVASALQVPRMIVNVVQILPMQTLREVRKPTPGCLLQRSSPRRLSPLKAKAMNVLERPPSLTPVFILSPLTQVLLLLPGRARRRLS